MKTLVATLRIGKDRAFKMAWEHLSINKPHLVYIILGGFTTLFMLVSSIIKERMYIGEATVATICGVIFGPYAANLINPGKPPFLSDLLLGEGDGRVACTALSVQWECGRLERA